MSETTASMTTPHKPPSRVTAADFEAVLALVQAKRQLMEAWRAGGVCYPLAVLACAQDEGVSVKVATERVDDMELLTGVRLERA